MNTTPAQRFASLALAAMMTLGMLFGVNGLASTDLPASDLAQNVLQLRA